MRKLDPRGEGVAFPVLLIGRKLGPEDIRQAIEHGARACMIKPFSGADVLDRVGRLFRPPPRSVQRPEVVWVDAQFGGQV
jgi:two-component system catabolic regulation response regulator CreB